jgi:hypothetical protein
VLGIVNPAAFARASRIRKLVRELTADLKIPSPWQVELAAMLSQIGCVGLAPETLNRVFAGESLSTADETAYRQHPKVGHDLIARIPRLEPIADMIAYQDKRFDGFGTPEDDVRGEAIPAGARVLKVALDFDVLVSARMVPRKALARLQQRVGWYDPAVLQALSARLGVQPDSEPRGFDVDELEPGMVFAESVYTASGLLLVAQGQEVTPSLLMRVKAVARNGGLDGDLKMIVPGSAAPATVDAAATPETRATR